MFFLCSKQNICLRFNPTNTWGLCLLFLIHTFEAIPKYIHSTQVSQGLSKMTIYSFGVDISIFPFKCSFHLDEDAPLLADILGLHVKPLHQHWWPLALAVHKLPFNKNHIPKHYALPSDGVIAFIGLTHFEPWGILQKNTWVAFSVQLSPLYMNMSKPPKILNWLMKGFLQYHASCGILFLTALVELQWKI